MIAYKFKEKLNKLALKYMKDCKNILDVGCGEGKFISYSPDRIVGVDNNLGSIKICQEKGFKVYKSLVTKLPFEDKSFDAVNCSHVIEHLYSKEAYEMLKEINRVLRIGGILCFRAPLLSRNFYQEFSHIKPYSPFAIYSQLNDSPNQTYLSIHPYKMIKLKYRYEPIISGVDYNFTRKLTVIGHILYEFGIRRLTKDAFFMILKKQ